jgi:transcriptional regulator with XRE-family HTH domain
VELNKVGRFITERRKAVGLTQHDLARKLNVTDQAVSKWERCKGMPDASLMIPLCELLKITVNELLCGEQIAEQDKVVLAEKQIIDLLHEKQANKKKIWLALTVAIIGFAVLLASIFVWSLLLDVGVTNNVLRYSIFTFGWVVFFVCLAVAFILDRDAGYYECKKCSHRFVPDMRSYMNSRPRIPMKKKLKCPQCDEISWCRRKLAKKG